LAAEEAVVEDLVAVEAVGLVDLAAEVVVVAVQAGVGNQMRTKTQSNTNSVKITS
jgi:hypothetical protein